MIKTRPPPFVTFIIIRRSRRKTSTFKFLVTGSENLLFRKRGTLLRCFSLRKPVTHLESLFWTMIFSFCFFGPRKPVYNTSIPPTQPNLETSTFPVFRSPKRGKFQNFLNLDWKKTREPWKPVGNSSGHSFLFQKEPPTNNGWRGSRDFHGRVTRWNLSIDVQN